MEAKAFLLHFILFVFICSHNSASSRILNKPSNFLSSASLPSGNAERLIKSFNLMPQHDVNIIAKGSPDAPRLVESQFNFPETIGMRNASGGPSVQEFGHYAGYYSIPSSKSAK